MNLDLIHQMKENKRPFYIAFSGSKINVKNDLGEFNFMDKNRQLTYKELGLLNSVKHFVKKNVNCDLINLPEKIAYIDFGFFLALKKMLLSLI